MPASPAQQSHATGIDTGRCLDVFDNDWFTPPERQIENLCNWNTVGPDSLKALVKKGIPEFERAGRPVALTLCWTLDTFADTVAAKLAIIRTVYGPDRVTVPEQLYRPDERYLAIVEGAPGFTPNCVWWQTIDLASARDIPIEHVRLARAAETQALDLACQHPAYIWRQDGLKVPYLTIPALRVHVPGYTSTTNTWLTCLDIKGHPNGYVGIGHYWCTKGNLEHAHATIGSVESVGPFGPVRTGPGRHPD